MSLLLFWRLKDSTEYSNGIGPLALVEENISFGEVVNNSNSDKLDWALGFLVGLNNDCWVSSWVEEFVEKDYHVKNWVWNVGGVLWMVKSLLWWVFIKLLKESSLLISFQFKHLLFVVGGGSSKTKYWLDVLGRCSPGFCLYGILTLETIEGCTEIGRMISLCFRNSPLSLKSAPWGFVPKFHALFVVHLSLCSKTWYRDAPLFIYPWLFYRSCATYFCTSHCLQFSLFTSMSPCSLLIPPWFCVSLWKNFSSFCAYSTFFILLHG